MFMLALPGSVYLYQGEELGLHEVWDLPLDVLDDPVWEQSNRTRKGRDGCRVPMPWTIDGPSLGFGENAGWLPQPADFSQLSVEAQAGVSGSTLELYRSALAARKTHLVDDDTIEWLDAPDGVIGLRRGSGVECWLNVSGAPMMLDPERSVLLASGEWTASCRPTPLSGWRDSRQRRPSVVRHIRRNVMTASMSTTTMAARCEAAEKVYGHGDTEVHALRDVTVGFEEGRFTAIMGPSGSGKSTLMQCMAGLDRLTAGETFIGDIDCLHPQRQGAHPLRRDKIGFIFQAFNLIPTLTAIGRTSRCRSTSPAPSADKAWIDQVIDDRRPRRSPDPPTQRALRRPATAGGRGQSAGQPSRDHLRRRADGQPRLDDRRRDPRLHAAGRPTISARPS